MAAVAVMNPPQLSQGGRTMFASVAGGTNELEVAAGAGLSPSVGGSALAAVVAAVTPAA